MTRFKYFSLICMATLMMYMLAIPAYAKIKRSCDARWILTDKSSGATAVLEEFSASGRCGSNVPNRCRERARDRAHSCMSKHWSTRFDRKRPVECTLDNGNRVSEYSLQDIKATIEAVACRQGWVVGNASSFASLSASTSGDKKCGKTYEVSDYEIKPAACANVLPTTPRPTSTTPPLALVIPANDKRDVISGLMFPSSMPSVRYPRGYNGCSANEKAYIKKSWAMGHYMTWVADQAMDWMERNDKYRKKAWYHNYRKPSASNSWVNFAPRGWFGAYGKKNFDIADDAIERLWRKRFLDKTFTVKCRTNDRNKGAHPCFRTNPGTGSNPSANHIVYGTINFCNSSFNNTSDVYKGGRRVVHELLHWLPTKNGTIVQDLHTHCHGVGRCTTNKGYGAEQASHLANYEGGNRGTKSAQKRRRIAHRKRALRNNDNYALFIYYMGRKSHEKTDRYRLPVVTQFPVSGFEW